MKDGSDPQSAVGGITEADFLRWKHHPVSKVLLRYLVDYAEALRRQQLDELEQTDAELPPKKQGEYKGRVNTLIEVASLEFEHLAAFYPPPQNEDDEGAEE